MCITIPISSLQWDCAPPLRGLAIESQADVPGYVDGPLFEAPHQRSTIHDQSVRYRMRANVFAPLHTVGLASHRGNGNVDEGCLGSYILP